MRERPIPIPHPGSANYTNVVSTLCEPELLAVRDRHMAELDAVCAGTARGAPPALAGIWGAATADPLREPATVIAEQLVSLAARRDQLADELVFRPPIAGVGIYGVHFVDALLGGDVFDLDGHGNWQTRPADRPVGTLEPPDWEQHPAWQAAAAAALAFATSGATVPFFCTPCLSSALNTAVNLYGPAFLEALYDNPTGARHDLRIITDLIVALHRWYRAHIPAAQLQAVAAGSRTRPVGMGHICGCSTQLLSADQYRDFIAPCDAAVLAVYPRGGMIHLCGTHTHLLPVWRDMLALRIIQVNDRASADLARYGAELRDDQFFYSLECPEVPWQKAIEITGGRRLVLTFTGDGEPLRAYRAWKKNGGQP